MSDFLERINQLNFMVSVEEVFDYIGAELAKEDPYRITYSCPYHTDDSPSLLVDKDKGKYNCFACECGGIGAYSAAKYYLAHTNNTKPTAMMVVEFLCEINPQIEQYKYLFAAKSRRQYDYGQDKRKAFNNRIKFEPPSVRLTVLRKSFTKEQMAVYIDAVMTGMSDEFILDALGVRNKKEEQEGSKEFLSLLEGFN